MTQSQSTVKTCLQCDAPIARARSKRAKFCDDACRVAYNRNNKKDKNPPAPCVGHLSHPCPDAKITTSDSGRCLSCKQNHNRYNDYPNTVIGSQVISTIKRAGTLETFPTLTAIKDFEWLCRTRQRCTSVIKGRAQKEYSISHKIPLKHSTYVGFSKADNLFLGFSKWNQQAGNVIHPQYLVDPSLYMKRSDLDPKCLATGLKQGEIMELLYKKYGSDFLNHIVDMNYKKRGKKSGLPEDLEVYGQNIAAVMGASIFTHFKTDKTSAMKLFTNALLESHQTNTDGSITYIMEPWKLVQDYLQSGDAFDCRYLEVDYEPVHEGMDWV